MTEGQPSADILDRIVRTKADEIESLRGRRSGVEARAASVRAPRDVLGPLEAMDRVAVIAEVKRRSPSAGALGESVDPVARAAAYAVGGAFAISVLTDGPFFGGSLEDLGQVRQRVEIPVLRKDFILDELQLLEARGAGADLVLLIARILTPRRLARLREETEALGMTALVEVHEASELGPALDAGARLLGINNRDLSTFTTDLGVTAALLPSVPRDVFVISESGVRTPADVATVGAAGAHGVLVGESLMRSEDPEKAVRALASVSRTVGPSA
ncbi:MAG: indole-3-glycerol phosphate synthase TrpC [Gemmatimonadota bacterium]|nr:indole-3-glycerol phosphate synthase TrpC [Gemmatimonadota bacterium]